MIYLRVVYSHGTLHAILLAESWCNINMNICEKLPQDRLGFE